jgi:archaellum component FlaC
MSMAFTVEDFHDLVRLLELHPEWRAELRRLVLSEEYLSVPERLAHLDLEVAEIRKEIVEVRREIAGIHEEIARINGEIARINQEIARINQEIARINQEIAQIHEEIAQIHGEIAQIHGEIAQIHKEIAEIQRDIKVLKVDVGSLKGLVLESRFRERAPAYLGRWMRRARVYSYQELADLLDEAADAGRLTPEEREDLMHTDLVARARRREDGEEVHVVAEVSWFVDLHDIERLTRRAATLQRALGGAVVPLVAGCGISPEAAQQVKRQEMPYVMLELAA